jgi:hypothetical protein
VGSGNYADAQSGERGGVRIVYSFTGTTKSFPSTNVG